MSELVWRQRNAIIPPSSFFVFWPGGDPPMAEEIRLRLGEWGQQSPDSGDQSPEETLWSFWLELADRPASYLVWCEQVSGAHLVLLDQVRWRNGNQESAARACRWMVGIEGALSLKQPAADYQYQLRLADAVSNGWSPVVFDANAFQFRTPQDVRHLVDNRIAPRSACLFSIHKVRSAVDAAGHSRYWIHTHGLERTGAPDLEIFDVPERLLPAACELLEAIADLWIEFSTPDPQVPFAIGRGLEIAWRPWQAQVAELGPDDVGGWKHRNEEGGHAGYRAVLVAGRLEGWFCRRWSSPLAVLEKLTAADTTLYKTSTETSRMALLARDKWSCFGMLFACRHPDDWRFAVKLNFPMDDNPGHGEHLWFDVVRIRPGQVLGTLVSNPSSLAGMQVGQTEWHDLSRLSDWRILTSQGAFGPETADYLLEEHEAVV